jgi:transcriptional regulator with XRE-family HTH domain
MKTNQNIKTILVNIYQAKQARNKGYSLRAFARDLTIDSAHLCRILKDKMRPTPFIAYKLGKYMNLDSSSILKLIEETL